MILSTIMKLKCICLLWVLLMNSCQERQTSYVCPPCNLDCDKLTFAEPGSCPHCNMVLMNAASLDEEGELKVNEIDFDQGSGKFSVEGGADTSKTVTVHYYQPSHFDSTSKVIIVLPGAGRNADDYRNAWIVASEKYNVLVLSLEYSEEHYPAFWSYNLAGMITNVDIKSHSFDINSDAMTWLFNDFDRIFNQVKNKLGLKTISYDLFGHSAGGQILHRLAIFRPQSQADRILAANSGWYTLPGMDDAFPYGLADSPFTDLEVSFRSKLVLFIGERDDADETRGHLRHGPEVDKQGLHRFARGNHFYETAKKMAMDDGKVFNWKLEIVPDVGHDHKLMSVAAADYLYAHKSEISE